MDFKLLDIGYDSSPKKKILVVDDETALQTVLFDTFSENFSVVAAHNGREGVSKAETFQPDLILMDVMMPDLNGYDAIKLLRANKTTQNIPVILMTAKGFDTSTIQMIKSEANVAAFIAKPFRIAEIRATVSKVLEK